MYCHSNASFNYWCETMRSYRSRIRVIRLKLRVVLLNTIYKYKISFKCGDNVTFGRNLDIRLHKNCSLEIGDSCHIGDGSLLTCGKNAKIKFGDNVLLFKNVYIVAWESIEIGRYTQIAEFSSIRDFDHSFSDIKIPIVYQGLKSSPIIIGEDVWIGRGVAVLKGVVIGRHSVIGANSVVTKNILQNTVYAGNPAKIIKYLHTSSVEV